MRTTLMLALFLPWLAPRIALSPLQEPEPRYPTAIPERPPGAASGSDFMRRLRTLSDDAREEAILAELRRGNLPSFLRRLRPVDVVARSADGRDHHGRFWAMPDYLAIGTDDDFLRVPMSPITAQLVADQFDCLLPTRKMVDEVYRQARVHLSPEPLPAGPQMTASDTYALHNELISQQLGDEPLGELVSGHKKDVVLSTRLLRRPARVAIYGWHRFDGEPIQPLSLFHPNWYTDYSHGVRLVAAMMMVDGAQRRVADVLQDPLLAPLLSDEGPVLQTRVCTERDRPRCVAAMPGGRTRSRPH